MHDRGLTDKLFRLAMSITGNREDAEDVVQDALLNVWKKQEEGIEIQNVEAYCFRSVRNIAIDKIALTDNQSLTWDENYDVPSATKSAQELLEQAEQMELLERCIRQLPEKQRTIFQLREVEELSYKEIAEAMNFSEEQVKVNLFRARQKLRELLTKVN
ncbi:DNA-directed RNA polymerase sigma-70 factor [Bacteroidia bacterium]|nr:DNA-directed RNA polymerase sigma-70 factor [Bacteroidia bacterium]